MGVANRVEEEAHALRGLDQEPQQLPADPFAAMLGQHTHLAVEHVGVVALREPDALGTADHPVIRIEPAPRVELDDPTAQALYYVHDVADIDTSDPRAARYEEGQVCENCVQLTGEAGEEWRPCNLYPGKLVASAGWCSVWAAIPE